MFYKHQYYEMSCNLLLAKPYPPAEYLGLLQLVPLVQACSLLEVLQILCQYHVLAH